MRPSRAGVLTVGSPKGGVGKTACAFLAASTLAERSGLRVVAIDADHDMGTLPLLVPDGQRADRGARQLLEALDSIQAAANLHPYLTVAPSGLHILAGPFGPADRPQISVANLATLIALFERFYDLVVVDLGTGLTHPVIRFAVRRADRVLMVTSPDWVAAVRVEAGLRRLVGRDRQGPVVAERLAVVVNRAGDAETTAALIERLRRTGVHCQVAIPEDAQLATMLDSGTYSLRPLDIATRIAIRDLALASARLG